MKLKFGKTFVKVQVFKQISKIKNLFNDLMF